MFVIKRKQTNKKANLAWVGKTQPMCCRKPFCSWVILVWLLLIYLGLAALPKVYSWAASKMTALNHFQRWVAPFCCLQIRVQHPPSNRDGSFRPSPAAALPLWFFIQNGGQDTSQDTKVPGLSLVSVPFLAHRTHPGSINGHMSSWIPEPDPIQCPAAS